MKSKWQTYKTRTYRWRLYALVTRRPYPFVLKGYLVHWCYFCCGWGDDPRDGSECPVCHGVGFRNHEGVERKRISGTFPWLPVLMNAFARGGHRKTTNTIPASRENDNA